MDSYTITEEGLDEFVRAHAIKSFNTKSNYDPTGAFTFALVGDLGVGKTTFSKHLLKALGVTEHVSSPTFSIINSYDISFKNFTKVYHVDVYRIEDVSELTTLHFEDILSNPNNIVIIEWADKIKDLIPESATWMYFGHDTTQTRKVTIKKNTYGKN